jgi:hypothetical protein
MQRTPTPLRLTQREPGAGAGSVKHPPHDQHRYDADLGLVSPGAERHVMPVASIA